ncbi:MAG: hypothetical protein KDD10_28275, partial [Phaeodactylibacter sp.]|nr:hypothetical protein [Phaeodactylibacter sp.]
MKTINFILILFLPLLAFGQDMPRNVDLGKPNPYPFITSALLAIDEAGKDNATKGIELARSKYMPVNDGKIYVEIVHGAVTDLDKPVDGKALEARLNIDVTTTYKNRASAWVEVGRLLDVARRLPPGHSLNEVVVLAEDNQGPGLMNSDTYATATTGGEGIRIAVIDGNYNGLTAARAAGAVPSLANSTFFNYAGGSFEGGSSSHGTSCLETVFDHAPNAEYYIMKVSSFADLGAAVQDCINNGVDIISHSISRYNTGWDDDTGAACAAAWEASKNGILFFTSAGNRNGTHWQGAFNDPDGDGWHNWSGTDEGNNFTINGIAGAAGTVQARLQWNSPSTEDHYDLYLYEAGTNNLLASSTNAGQFESLNYSTTTGQQVYLAVRANTPNPPEFELFNHDARCTNFQFASTRSSTTSPSNSTSPNVISVGALPMADYNQPPGTTGIIAAYSSRGPTNNGNPAPDLCAPTNTTTTGGAFTGT